MQAHLHNPPHHFHQPQQQSLHGTSIVCHQLLSAEYRICRQGMYSSWCTIMGQTIPDLDVPTQVKLISPLKLVWFLIVLACIWVGLMSIWHKNPKSRWLLLVKFSSHHTPRHLFLGSRQHSHCPNIATKATMSPWFYNDLTHRHTLS